MLSVGPESNMEIPANRIFPVLHGNIGRKTSMFGTKVRPIRLAHLVDPNDPGQVREAIRLSSTLWGGSYCPIITLYKRMPATWKDLLRAPLAMRVISGYIDAFDPDILVQFSKTIPDSLKQSGLEVIRPETVWENLKEHRSPQYGLGVFELFTDIFEEHFKYKPKYPIKVVIPKIPPQLSLFWASLFGEYPATISSLLEKYYLEPLEVKMIDFQLPKLTELMENNVLFPRRITQRGLTPFNRSGFGRDAFVYFCDATKVEDVVDFWNLRALGKSVIPLPKQLQDDPQLRDIVIGFLKFNRRPWKHNPQVCDTASIVRARSRTMEQMQEYAKTLKIDREPNDPSLDGFFSLQHWYPRIWDEWAKDKDGAVPADIYSEEEKAIEVNDVSDREEAEIHFRPLLPELAQGYGYYGAPRCANEISFHLYGPADYLAEAFPKSSGDNFSRAISGLTSSRGDWRVGKNGLVMLVKHDFNEIRNIPTAETIVFSWLTDLGWKPELSAPGLIAKQIRRTLEGSPYLLRNERVLGLFEHMNGGSVKQDGSPVESNKVTQERDLPVGEVKNRVDAASERGNLYDYLISRGIFKLGLRPQCPRCLRHSWFALENVRDTFNCPKCLNVFPAIGNLGNVIWSYKTTGPFSVPNYADGAYAVLALEFFGHHKMHTLRTTPVLSFKATAANKKDLEADFALFWQESMFGEKRDGIMFGECKTYGRFEKKDYDRMRYLAKVFPGAVLVFSTLRKSLTPKEVVEISRIAKAGRKYWKPERPLNPLLLLTGTELLDWSGPPYCWEDSVRKRFDHVRGLLDICDATQQIYLNLPSWQAEWHEKWEKKRLLRQAKEFTSPVVTGT